MSNRKLVAIHQPNFFPWLGYFDKLARADVFILLGDVQFPQTGRGTWLNRVRLIINGEAKWVTMPIDRSFEGLHTVNEIQISDHVPWRNKMLKSVKMSYHRAPFFEQIFPVLSEMVANPSIHLAEYNRAAIVSMAKLLGLDTRTLIDSSALHVDGVATDRLIELVQAVGGTAYLCGGGASGYQDDEKFAAAGLELVYQDFLHPVYPQVNSQGFVAGLSLIDALMNCSWSGTRALLGVTETRS